MKLIHPSYEIIEQGSGLQGIYEQIERAGRTCYKSEDKITEGSAEKFVNAMIKSGHGAMLEHGTVYLKIPLNDDDWLAQFDGVVPTWTKVGKLFVENGKAYIPITTNYRVLYETFTDEAVKELLEFLCEPTKHHEKRYTVRFICDRGVSHEIVRHKLLCVA